MEAIGDRLVHQRVFRNPHLTGEVFGAGGLVREDRGQQVVGEHPLDGGRHPLAGPPAGHRERPGCGPTPAHEEQGYSQNRLGQHRLEGCRLEEREHRLQRERVQVGQGDDDAVIGCRRLEFQVEGPAEALPEREPPSPVDPASEGSVDHELHPARLVEEPLDNHGALARHGAQRGPASGEIADELVGAAGLETRSGAQLVAGLLRRAFVHPFAEFRHPHAQFGGPPRRLSPPEGNRRRCALGVLDPDLSFGDPPDPPGGGPEQEDVAPVALDGEVLVELADDPVLGFGDHLILRRLRDRSAALDGRQPGAPAGAHRAGHDVPVQVGAAPAARGRDAFREHGDEVVEHRPLESPVGVGAAHEIEQLVQIVPLLGRGSRFRHELLGEDVEGRLGDADPVQVSRVHRRDQCRTLDQFIPGGGKEASLRSGSEPMSRAAHPLEGDRDGTGRAELADQVHRTDVDPELEGGGRDDGPDLPGLEPALGLEPHLPGEAPVMGEYGPRGKPFAQIVGQPLRQPAGIHEHEGGVVFLDEGGDPVPDVLHDLVARHRTQFTARNLHREVEFPAVADVNDGRSPRRPRAQEAGHLGYRPDGGGEADALQVAPREPVEAFEREREMASALVARERVDLVHDHGVRGREELTAAGGGEQQVERFRRRDQDVGRLPGHPGPLGGRRVSGAEFGAERGNRIARRRGPRGDSGERDFEIPADIGAQRLERRDIDDARFVRQRSDAGLPGEPVQREQERGERLARAGGRGDQDVFSPRDDGPAPCLGFSGRFETLLEPAGNRGVEAGEQGGQWRFLERGFLFAQCSAGWPLWRNNPFMDRNRESCACFSAPGRPAGDRAR